MAKQFARAHELMGVAVENEMLTFIFKKCTDRLIILYFKSFYVLHFLRSATVESLCCKPKYRENLFKYILLVLAILFFVTCDVRISLPSVFCILDNLLIQVYKRSGTHRFVAVVVHI